MSLVAEDAVITSTTVKTKTTSDDATGTAKSSVLALALHAWTMCVLLVVLSALLLLAPSAIAIAFPVACMAASLYLLCAIAARLPALAHLPPPSDRARERRGGVRESRKQDLVEVDRTEAPGGFDDDDASSAEEEHGERSEHGRHEFSSANEEDLGGSCYGEVFLVDTYYKSFYDLLTFWRSLERRQWR